MQAGDNNSGKHHSYGKESGVEREWEGRNVNHRGISPPRAAPPLLAIGILQQTELAFSLFNINRMATEIHPSQPVRESGSGLISDFDWSSRGWDVRCTRRKVGAFATYIYIKIKHTPCWTREVEIHYVI